MIEKLLAGGVLLVCVALLLRQTLRERQRQRVDAAAFRAVSASRHLAHRRQNRTARLHVGRPHRHLLIPPVRLDEPFHLRLP